MLRAPALTSLPLPAVRCPRQPYSRRQGTRAAAAAMASSVEERKEQLGQLVAKLDKMFQVPNVTAPELHAMLEDPARKVVVVDVRLPEEVAVSTLPGVLTAEQFEAQKEALRDYIVVAYCTAGYRSSKLVQQLRAEGWDASNAAGGILAWTHEGYPLVEPPSPSPSGQQQEAEQQQEGGQQQQQLPVPHGDKEGRTTNRVHVFGKQWELQAPGYEPVMFGHPFVEYAKGAVRKVLPRWLGGR